MNSLKTVGLLAFMTALLFWLAYELGAGIWVAIGIAVVFNLIAYFFSDKIALATTRAQPVTEQELPQVYSIVRRLTTATSMPMPKIHVIDS
ncbi:MAG TPA: protease HtpX, partial [Acidimicrobiia bacterium]|nr:protease HtpX [Acidimicrobiia bacterium]